MFFEPAFDPFVTCKTPGPGKDILQASANNLYVGVTMKDLEGWKDDYELNSRVVKRNGRIEEEVYKVGGRYDAQLRDIVSHLKAAIPFATAPMAKALRALIKWYETGETADRLEYDIAWVQDKDSPVDTINGFTEVYLDARGLKGAWEAVVYYVNHDKTSAIQKIAANAQWFEDRMPWDPAYRKEGVKGITANAIDIVVETGDSGPVTPIGINLPNDQVIREKYGSKSVSLSNINDAYEGAMDPGFRTEFSWSPEEAARSEKFGAFVSELTTDLHEVIGHGSGKVADRLNGSPQTVLKEHYSALEESRADLVALYFLPDEKLVELGLIKAEEQAEVVQAEYESYARAAIVQLRRVREGTQIEEDHMRNRQMIVGWLMANTRAIERRTREGKTYYVMVDAEGVPERRGASPGGRAAHQVRRGLRRGQDALRDLRRAFRRGASRRGGGARGPAEPSVLHRIRAAAARAGDRRGRHHRGRRHLVSAGPDEADAGVRGDDAREPRGISRGRLALTAAPSMFASRLRGGSGRNRLSAALDARRAAGLPILDLTESNPTRAGFDYPASLLEPLARPQARVYAPQALGLPPPGRRSPRISSVEASTCLPSASF